MILRENRRRFVEFGVVSKRVVSNFSQTIQVSGRECCRDLQQLVAIYESTDRCVEPIIALTLVSQKSLKSVNVLQFSFSITPND